MILELKAKHFNKTGFMDNCNCAISKAAKELFYTEDVNEAVECLFVDGVQYSHTPYDMNDFIQDMEKAKDNNFDETVIRNIELKPL